MKKFNQFCDTFFPVNESSYDTNKGLQKRIVDASSGALGIHSTNNRVKNLQNVSIEEFSKLIGALLGVDTQINAPGKSGSSKFPSVQFDYGEKTRNFILAGGAVASRGHEFEDNFLNDLKTLQANRVVDSTSYNYPGIIKAIVDQFGITEETSFTASKEGGANKKRPITVTSNGVVIGEGGNLDIGSTITDITLDINGQKKYISLKLGNTVQFSNTGLVDIFPKTEVESGQITNEKGTKLLGMFGIDNQTFCDVFNSYGKKKFKAFHELEKSIEPKALIEFIQSSMGYGYYMLHIADNEKTFEFYEVTETIMKRATAVKSKLDVLYGGVTGGAKNVYVSFKTDEFFFEVDFRNRSGSVEPTVMGTKYKYLAWKGTDVSLK
jgi:hypothetical protein